jgi:hypothetical protein
MLLFTEHAVLLPQVYPLVEPPRFQPLFIEKATLPDIMDPVIEPHLRWLGRSRSQNPNGSRSSSDSVSAATCSTDGSSAISSWESAAASIDGTSSSSSSSGGLLQTLLEPVEIVEPTFRQMLVVYRKKPKPERWREAWFKLTGQKVAAVARRSTIQLQVSCYAEQVAAQNTSDSTAVLLLQLLMYLQFLHAYHVKCAGVTHTPVI